MHSPILVLTTFPDIDTTQRLAEELVQAKLAACVNISPAGQSIYIWEGKLCKETEHMAVIKTTDNCYEKIEQYIQAQHPYELPEIITTPISNGSKEYLTWLTNCLNTNTTL
jgi:periplasmic divalent cation tolerance protein